MAGEDERYYIECPLRKNRARIPVTLCFNCEFATGYIVGEEKKEIINIGCGFPKVSRPEIHSRRRRRRKR